MTDLIWIVSLLVIFAAILGGMVGWCIATVNVEKRIKEASYNATTDYFLATQDYEPLDIET